ETKCYHWLKDLNMMYQFNVQRTRVVKTQTEVASPNCVISENREQKPEATNTTCEECSNSVTKTREMLISSRERNAILRDISKNLEELLSL
ncbi:hypothetical protein DPMN_109329, partial [Dreissena polymorpha]